MQPTDKRRLRGEKSKNAIVDAAIASIAARGLRSLTLDRVAQQAEVSRALVVFHFKSKTGMLTAVLAHMSRLYSQGWDEALAASDATSDKLLKLLEYDVQFASEQPELLSVWHAFWGEARGSSLYREVSHPSDERYERDLRRLLDELAVEGDYQDLDITAVGTGISAMLFGLWRNSHLVQGPNDYEYGMRALRVYLQKIFPKHY